MAKIEDITGQYIRRKELARELGERLRGRPYKEMTLLKWMREGRGPPVTKLGREVYYFIPSVQAWLRSLEGPVA
jgi:hypothetical protein